MDIASLQAFITVAEHHSFSLAAEALFLTQPAVSKRIAHLEHSLDTSLFDRLGRQTLLTEAGRALLPRAQAILAQLEDSRRAIRNLTSQVGGRMSIGTSHHIGLHRLPTVLRRYTRAYPDVELDLHFMDSEAACLSVEQGRLELGIVTLPLVVPDTLEARRIWPDPLLLVASADHRLLQNRQTTQVDVATLADWPAILPARGTYTREVMERAFAPMHLQVRMSTHYLETIKMLVSIGLGWGILPATMLDDKLVQIHVPGLHLIRELGVVRHRARTLSNAARSLLTLLQDENRETDRLLT